MFEPGDVTFLPPSFGAGKKGVLVRKEPDGRWLIQIGTSAHAYLLEKELRPITRISSCWKCGAPLNNSHDQACSCQNDNCKCLVCGACKKRDIET
jgi:hypothetical protein